MDKGASGEAGGRAPAATVRVTHDGQTGDYPVGLAVRDLPGGPADAHGLRTVGALVNNDVVTLSYPLDVECRVERVTAANRHGWRIYRNSLAFLAAKVVHEQFPDAQFAVEHSLGSGFFCSFAVNGEPGIRPAALLAIERRMRRLVEADLPIQRGKVAYEKALHQFEAEGQQDKVNLLRFRNPPKIVIYTCDGFTDLAHGVLADRTGALAGFRLHAHPPGFVIQFPDPDAVSRFSDFDPQPHLFEIFREHKEWGRILGLRTVGDLNRMIANREMPDMIRIAEALHEKKIARLADRIAADRKRIRWVLIAGPSSSGKTTFSKRLMVQLRVNGMRPVAISIDDYFVDRDRTPRDAAGEPDFEHIETVDLPLLHAHLRALDEGGEVELPRFDFLAGTQSPSGRRLRLADDEVAIVEGIHALNPRLTESLPPSHVFRIYVSALTQLNLDYHNRVSTTDNRLLRRLVRDHLFRGNDALTTLGMWPSVRRGEKTWIFPHQQRSDAAFNSALDYELAVLKPFAEPLLQEVKPYHAAYAEARRLLVFLDAFLPLSFGGVPPTSILREFIGRSAFRY